MLLGRQIEGVWHTGVVVYGREYFYGELSTTEHATVSEAFSDLRSWGLLRSLREVGCVARVSASKLRDARHSGMFLLVGAGTLVFR